MIIRHKHEALYFHAAIAKYRQASHNLRQFLDHRLKELALRAIDEDAQVLRYRLVYTLAYAILRY